MALTTTRYVSSSRFCSSFEHPESHLFGHGWQLFLRGKPHLQKYMRRLPKTHKKLPMKKGTEPDFYKMDKENSLPALENAPIPGSVSAVQALREQPARPIGMSHGLEQHVVTPPRVPTMMGPMSGAGAGMQQRGLPPSSLAGTAVGSHAPARFAHPTPMYPSSPIDTMGAFDEYDMGSSRSMMMHASHPGHPANAAMMMPPSVAYGRPAPMRHPMRQPDFYDQMDYFAYQQQQQMKHMQQFMFERQQAAAMAEDSYGMMRPNASSPRY